MKARRMIIGMTTAAAMLAFTACGGDNSRVDGEVVVEDVTHDLVLVTVGTAGLYYPFGGELATIYENEIVDISVNYVESGGSAENVGQIYQEEWQIGFAD